MENSKTNYTNHRLGLSMSLITMLAWATLPLTLRINLVVMDALTLSWYRFLCAFLMAGAFELGLVWVRSRRNQPSKRPLAALSKRDWLLLALAATMLCGNFLTYLFGLEQTSPANAQMLIQLAPILLALGGLMFFGETYSRNQWLGLVILVSGLGLFFGDQLNQSIAYAGTYYLGSLALVIAAASWAVYALIQKHLATRIGSRRMLVFIFGFSTLLLWPLADPHQILSLDRVSAWAFVYNVTNTLLAYGAFSIALANWHSSRVSSVLALTPVSTLLVLMLVAVWWPEWGNPTTISAWAWLGAGLVMTGSLLTTLAGRNQTTAPKPGVGVRE